MGGVWLYSASDDGDVKRWSLCALLRCLQWEQQILAVGGGGVDALPSAGGQGLEVSLLDYEASVLVDNALSEAATQGAAAGTRAHGGEVNAVSAGAGGLVVSAGDDALVKVWC